MAECRVTHDPFPRCAFLGHLQSAPILFSTRLTLVESEPSLVLRPAVGNIPRGGNLNWQRQAMIDLRGSPRTILLI